MTRRDVTSDDYELAFRAMAQDVLPGAVVEQRGAAVCVTWECPLRRSRAQWSHYLLPYMEPAGWRDVFLAFACAMRGEAARYRAEAARIEAALAEPGPWCIP